MSVKNNYLDNILIELGELGKYQTFVLMCFAFAIFVDSVVHTAYVFSAGDINYRCEIPECESSNNTDWLKYAVPYKNDKPSKCERYQTTSNLYTNSTCSLDHFDRNFIERCDKFVYESPEVTIVNDFELFCEENKWKLTMVGTINNIGLFIGLPIAGILSDRYGRRTVLVLGMIFSSFAGLARAFSPSYIWFVTFEFLDAALASGTYACGFILGVELVGPSKRVLTGVIISYFYSIGEVIVALLAWWIQTWRLFLIVIYIPPLLLLSFFWITPESVRWLLSQGRTEDAQNILRKVAKINNKTISEESLASLGQGEDKETETYPFKEIFKSRIILLRFCTCCICWITCTFLFYGLTLNSVDLAGNTYVDFILISLVEMPAAFVTNMTLDRWGRRTSQCFWYLLTGFSCLSSMFISQDIYIAHLIIYLVGKFGATAAFTVVYVLTSEIFPTPLRHSLLGTCSMIGRIGSMIAPQMPLLGLVWKPLPLLLFGIMGTIAGLLSLLFPETLNTELPDTIEEAENIGKQNIKKTET